MAITFSISKIADSSSRKEVKIRYKAGKYAARGKSGIFILPEWFDFVTGSVADTVYKGKRIVTPEMKENQVYHDEQKTALAKLIKNIDEALQYPDLDRSNSEWLHDCIDCYHKRGKYAPVETKKGKIKTLFQWIDAFMLDAHNRTDKTGKLLSPRMKGQYKVTQRHLKEFADSVGKQDFDFAEIDQNFYKHFVGYLQKKNFATNYIGKHIQRLKLFLNEAENQGYNSTSKHKDFTVYKEEVDAISLNETELQQIHDADLSNQPHLARVRDAFLLLAWTGCRYSDLSKIHNYANDGFLTFRQKKTNNKVIIPVFPHVTEILNRYNGNPPQIISNQKFNGFIKEVAKIAGLTKQETITRTRGGERRTEVFEAWQLVSSHTGRRSFCSNMYRRKIPTISIMAVSGHTSESAFLKYIKISNEEHAALMRDSWNISINTKNQ
ncbi:MAG: site-specific integrase [Tannerella sp.]|jgi:integrase|nr:site-specific integrase [Tannerella sp.]